MSSDEQWRKIESSVFVRPQNIFGHQSRCESAFQNTVIGSLLHKKLTIANPSISMLKCCIIPAAPSRSKWHYIGIFRIDYRLLNRLKVDGQLTVAFSL